MRRSGSIGTAPRIAGTRSVLIPTFLSRWAYSCWTQVAVPARFVRLWWLGRRHEGYRGRLRERLALGGARAQPGAIWVHAQTLGEVRTAAVLIAKLRDLDPRWRYLLTHGDAEGRVSGRALLQPGDAQAWLPFDTPGATRRFFKRHRPRVGVLIGQPAGPNLLHKAKRAGVPLYLANARLTPTGLESVQRHRALLTPALQSLEGVLAQSDADAMRLAKAGAHQVRVYGNVDFDIPPPVKLIARGHEWRQAIARPVVLAAGTHDGEERALLDAWKTLPAPRPLLVIVPRNAIQLAQVEFAVRQRGLRFERRSAWGKLPPPGIGQADVLLGDSVGEMAAYYGLADVALLGGSFRPEPGNQNLIDAAVCGCPILMGPNTRLQENAAELVLTAAAAERLPGIHEAVTRAAGLAGDPRRNTMVRNVFAFAAAHHGALNRVVGALLAQMSRKVQPKALAAPAVRLRLGR